jgi:hypothetical protein
LAEAVERLAHLEAHGPIVSPRLMEVREVDVAG